MSKIRWFSIILLLALIPQFKVTGQDFKPGAGDPVILELLPVGGFEPVEAIGTYDPDDFFSITRGGRPAPRVEKQDIYGRTLTDDFFYHRNNLNADEKLLYDQIYANAVEFNQNFMVQSYVPRKRIINITEAVRLDNPDLFWLQARISYSYGGDDHLTGMTITFNSTAKNIEESKKIFNDAANSVLQEAMNLPNEAEKIKFIHDWMTYFITYQGTAPLNQSAYSAIVSGKTVCAGYSMAFTYFMQRLGIRSVVIHGRARGGRHSWNLVRIDDKYYEMDVTWNNPNPKNPEEYNYDYFNITTEKISKSHTRDAFPNRTIPKASGIKYSYPNYFGDSPGSDFSNLNYGYPNEQLSPIYPNISK